MPSLLPLYLCALAAPQGSAGAVEIALVRGASARGDLKSLSTPSIVLEAGGESPRTIAMSECLSLRFTRPEARGDAKEADAVRVELEGGDRITGALAGGSGDQLRITLGGKTIPIKVDAIRKLVFADRVPRGFVESAPPANSDRLYKRNQVGADGESVVEPVNGTVLSFQDAGVEFEGVFGKDVFPWDRVVMLIVSPIGGKRPDPKKAVPDAVVSLLPEGRLLVRLGSIGEGSLQVESSSLGSLSLPMRAIRGIRFRGDRFTWLSELDPVEAVEQPYFGGDGAPRFPWRRDRSVTGGPLRVGGAAFDSGLGVHSRSVLTYALDGKFAGFRAKVGIDDETLELPRRGSVVFRVSADGRKLWESGVVRSGDRAVEIPEVDVRGAKRLTLEVDYADGFDIADRADWCEPILLTESAASAPSKR